MERGYRTVSPWILLCGGDGFIGSFVTIPMIVSYARTPRNNRARGPLEAIQHRKGYPDF